MAVKKKPGLNGLVPGTMSQHGYVPKGQTQRVRCDIWPDVPDFYVWFNVAIAWEIRRSDYEAQGETPVERAARKMAFYVDHFENWRFINWATKEPIPEPTRDDWESWRPMVSVLGLLPELGVWVMNDGFSKALDQAL